MPIFEYRCEKCGQTNEFLILGKQEPLHCRHCGGEDLTKLMSAHNTSSASPERFAEKGPGSCCGSPHSCDTPGGCCSR
jgi:putative FmdB family regulatory protein